MNKEGFSLFVAKYYYKQRVNVLLMRVKVAIIKRKKSQIFKLVWQKFVVA
jgi:hypothetical protein